MDSPTNASPESSAFGQSDSSDPAASTSPPTCLELTTALNLNEDQTLALLQRPDYPSESIEQRARNASLMKSRKVRIAIAAHPRTPRHISLRLIRELYPFDLMRFALQP